MNLTLLKKSLIAKLVKRLMITGILLCLVQLLNAQDSLVKSKTNDSIVERNGTVIIAKVVEVNPDNIRFRRVDNLDGPLYTLPKEQIKYVVYANGYKESFEDYVAPKINILSPSDLSITASGWGYFYKDKKLSEQEMIAVAGKAGDQKTNLAIRKTNNLRIWQNVTQISAIPLLVVGLYDVATSARYRMHHSKYGQGTLSSGSSFSQTQKKLNGEYFLIGGLVCQVATICLRFDRKMHAHIVMALYNKAILK